MDALDRTIINELQGGFPVCDHPFQLVAQRLGIDETQLLRRLEAMQQQGLISRFGPMYHAEKLGGALSLVAMRIPEAEFDHVAALVNAHPEVAHNYARDHDFNMWFVLATENPQQLSDTLRAIEAETGHPVYNMPKEKEFFLGLRLTV